MEKDFPENVATQLVKEGKAEFIEKRSPPKTKVLKTLETVMEEAQKLAAEGEREKFAAAHAGEGVAVKKKG
jgi:hypothetical protein